MRYLGLIALSLTALLGISFAMLNAQQVHFDYYVGTQELPLSLLLIGTFVLGIIIGMLTFLSTIFKLKYEVRRLRRHHG